MKKEAKKIERVENVLSSPHNDAFLKYIMSFGVALALAEKANTWL